MQHEKDAALFAAIKEFWVNDDYLDICEFEDPEGEASNAPACRPGSRFSTMRPMLWQTSPHARQRAGGRRPVRPSRL